MTIHRNDEPSLDAVLDAAGPPTPLGDALTPAAAAAAVEEARRRARSGSWAGRRPVLAATATIALGLVGVGAAAAVTQADWSPWAQDPDVTFTFALPSGATCEFRIGDVQGADPQVVAAARQFFRDNDVLAMADVDAAITSLRTQENTYQLPGGEVVPAPYGSEYYMSPDTEYSQAVYLAVQDVFADELDRRGIELGSSGAYDSFGGEGRCPGAQW